MKQEIKISGIQCGACVEHVKKALSQIPEAQVLKVTKENPQAIVEAPEEISLQTIRQVLSEKGNYSATEVNVLP